MTDRIEQLIPKRNIVAGELKQPKDVGYDCPICENKGQCLTWSEYSGFLVCRSTSKEMPSIICHRDINKAINIYLDLIEEIREEYRPYDIKQESVAKAKKKSINKAKK